MKNIFLGFVLMVLALVMANWAGEMAERGGSSALLGTLVFAASIFGILGAGVIGYGVIQIDNA